MNPRVTVYPCIIPGTRGPRIYMARGIFLVLLSLHGSAANCVGPADCSCHGPCHYRYGDRNYCDFRGSAIVQASHVAQYGVPESCVGQTCISCTTQTYYSVAPCCAKPPPSPPPSPLPAKLLEIVVVQAVVGKSQGYAPRYPVRGPLRYGYRALSVTLTPMARTEKLAGWSRRRGCACAQGMQQRGGAGG